MPGSLKTIRFSLFCCCLLLACCLALTVAPAMAAPTATPPVAMRIGYQPISSPTATIFEVIKRDRLLRQELLRHNLVLACIPFKKGSDSVEAFRRGELDAIALGELPMIEFALSTPVVIISQLRRGFSTVVAPRGTTPRGLKGKRIGNTFASSGHYALLKTLESGGLSERDVTLVPLDVNEMPDALLKGKIDAFSVWEPTPSLFIAQHPDRFSSVGRQMGMGYLSFFKPFALRHPEGIALLAAAQARAMHWLAKDRGNLQQAVVWHRAAMQELSGSPFSVPAEELGRKVAADLQVLQYSARLPSMKEKGKCLLADEFTFLKGIGKLPQSAEWETVCGSFDHNIMERVYNNPKSSQLNRFDYDLR